MFIERIFSLLIFLSLFSVNSFSIQIKVLVVSKVKKAHLKINSRFSVFSPDKKIKFLERRRLKNSYVLAHEWGISIAGYGFKSQSILIVPKKKNSIFLNKKQLRGNLLIFNKNKFLYFVNLIDLEEYLKGVVPKEMPFWWPLEALKAQAVVARTYALYKIKNNKENFYDVCISQLSQVYGFKKSEHIKTNIAVFLTKNEVLTYKGEIFPTYYHACCGGRTANAKLFFKKDYLPLRGIKDPYCKGTKFYSWKKKIPKSYLIKMLLKKGYVLKDIKNIKITKRTESGRCWEIEIEKETGSVIKIWGPDLRKILKGKILSDLYEIRLKGKYVYFEGRGWGHGVGLCQWGAFVMAKKGKNYKEILSFYYPGSELKKINEDFRF